jgi:hypothetical protein
VEILLAARGADLWGIVDPTTGAVAVHEPARTGNVELVNLAAVQTLLHGGTVHLIDPPEVPAMVRLPAAIYWRPHGQKKAGG